MPGLGAGSVPTEVVDHKITWDGTKDCLIHDSVGAELALLTVYSPTPDSIPVGAEGTRPFDAREPLPV